MRQIRMAVLTATAVMVAASGVVHSNSAESTTPRVTTERMVRHDATPELDTDFLSRAVSLQLLMRALGLFVPSDVIVDIVAVDDPSALVDWLDEAGYPLPTLARTLLLGTPSLPELFQHVEVRALLSSSRDQLALADRTGEVAQTADDYHLTTTQAVDHVLDHDALSVLRVYLEEADPDFSGTEVVADSGTYAIVRSSAADTDYLHPALEAVGLETVVRLERVEVPLIVLEDGAATLLGLSDRPSFDLWIDEADSVIVLNSPDPSAIRVWIDQREELADVRPFVRVESGELWQTAAVSYGGLSTGTGCTTGFNVRRPDADAPFGYWRYLTTAGHCNDDPITVSGTDLSPSVGSMAGAMISKCIARQR